MRTLAWLLLALVTTASAVTPLSISDKVYRETIAVASIRRTSERTVQFQPDGRFITLIDSVGSPLNASAPSRTFLQTTRDGTYRYERVSDTLARANLTYDDGSTSTIFIPPDATDWTGDRAIQLTDTTAAAPILNLSLRGHVTAGHPLIAGLVVGGAGTDHYQQFVPPAGVIRREILVRAVGPGLTAFGVTGVWADPDFQIFQADKPVNVNEAHYSDWTGAGTGATASTTETEFRKVFKAVGAFPLDAGSKDAAAVVRLSPGAYTIVCAAADGDAGGEVLIETYLLP